MKITLLHTADALEPPEDPVLGQLTSALESLGHEATRLAVDSDVEPLVHALKGDAPDLVFNLAESFGGKSALESNVAALLSQCRQRLPAFMVPAKIVEHATSLPRNPNGKIDRKLLAQELQTQFETTA